MKPRQRDSGAAAERAGARADLRSNCVPCIGGRTASVDAYRRLIESCGGQFIHHDGGLEESPHRIDGALAATDLVVCQAGCISHNAYWRVKENCKRTGKPGLFIRGGVSGFSRRHDESLDENR